MHRQESKLVLRKVSDRAVEAEVRRKESPACNRDHKRDAEKLSRCRAQSAAGSTRRPADASASNRAEHSAECATSKPCRTLLRPRNTPSCAKRRARSA